MVVEPHTLSVRYLLDFDHDLNLLDGRRTAECGSITGCAVAQALC